MRIGELSDRSGVSRDTIRLYERRGLIRSEAEGSGTNSYRAYGEEALMTLDIVREAQAAGLSLSDLTVFLAQLAGERADADGIAFLDARIAEVQDRLTRADRFLQMLQDTRAALLAAPHADP